LYGIDLETRWPFVEMREYKVAPSAKDARMHIDLHNREAVPRAQRKPTASSSLIWPGTAYLESQQMFCDATRLRLGVDSMKIKEKLQGDLQRAWFWHLSQKWCELEGQQLEMLAVLYQMLTEKHNDSILARCILLPSLSYSKRNPVRAAKHEIKSVHT
jgi:hypothetical protein